MIASDHNACFLLLFNWVGSAVNQVATETLVFLCCKQMMALNNKFNL